MLINFSLIHQGLEDEPRFIEVYETGLGLVPGSDTWVYDQVLQRHLGVAELLGTLPINARMFIERSAGL